MTKYAAFLRGIGPLNPNMRNPKLREVFESLGLSNVQTVISSGNVLFDTSRTDVAKLEPDIEQALQAQLGFYSATIIRSKRQLQTLVTKNPFNDRAHGQKCYLTITFLKNKPQATLVQKAGYQLFAVDPQTIASVVDMTQPKTPQLMVELEKQFGKQITTRTWKTVERVLARLE